MTLEEIYEEFTPGSTGFVKAVKTHCGFDLSTEEAERIASRCKTAAEFQQTWENEEWWTDAKNAA